MRVKLDRWVAGLLHSETRREIHHADTSGISTFLIESTPSNELNELCIEIDVLEILVNEDMLVAIMSKFGGSVSIEYFEED